MEGGDLRAALAAHWASGELQWRGRGKAVALDVARGLTSLHAARVVHRDLKSKNVLLTAGAAAAKVADVGVASMHVDGYLSAGDMVGTLAYAAPELLMGARCTDAVDVYSLGVLLWEIATGAAPTRGCAAAAPPPPSPACPPELAVLIAACTAAKPRARPSAKAVHDALLAIPPALL